MTNNVNNTWDYSFQAEYYKYRPNYEEKTIELLVHYVSNSNNKDLIVADIGAGTGNLTILLLNNELNVKAIEPNNNMRNIGIERTKQYKNVEWLKASGTDTLLKDKSINWVTFGSSFNVLDRELALKETFRILKNDGYFSCMWNHRDLDCVYQNKIEKIIEKYIPDYERGVRRQDQKEIIQNSGLFKNILYIEKDFEINQSVENYIKAWKSVKNKYWDLSTKAGIELFEIITDDIRTVLPETFNIKYTTRIWTAQKVN